MSCDTGTKFYDGLLLLHFIPYHVAFVSVYAYVYIMYCTTTSITILVEIDTIG